MGCGEKMAWNMQLFVHWGCWMCKTHYFHCAVSSYVMQADGRKAYLYS